VHFSNARACASVNYVNLQLNCLSGLFRGINHSGRKLLPKIAHARASRIIAHRSLIRDGPFFFPNEQRRHAATKTAGASRDYVNSLSYFCCGCGLRRIAATISFGQLKTLITMRHDLCLAKQLTRADIYIYIYIYIYFFFQAQKAANLNFISNVES